MTGENIAAPTAETTEGRGRAKERIGLVVAAHTKNTVVVQVQRHVKNSAYGKIQVRHRKFAVHDLMGCTVGEFVRIRETRPISKTKRWRTVEKLGRDKTAALPVVE
jgi:small subunit ribosomal protein S17